MMAKTSGNGRPWGTIGLSARLSICTATMPVLSLNENKGGGVKRDEDTKT